MLAPQLGMSSTTEHETSTMKNTKRTTLSNRETTSSNHQYLDTAPLRDQLSQHRGLLERHGSLAWLEKHIAELEQSFVEQSHSLELLALNPSRPEAVRAQQLLEQLATHTLAGGFETITRAVDTCLNRTTFEVAYQTAETQLGPLVTTRDAASTLGVSPWDVNGIMRRAGAEKIHVTKDGRGFPRVFWRLNDCTEARNQRALN